jgi:hypothetical protein
VNVVQRLKLTRCREDDDVREHLDNLADMRKATFHEGQRHARRQVYASILMPSYQSAFEHHCRFRRNEWHIYYSTPAIVIKSIPDEYDQRTLEQDKALPAGAPQRR